MPTTRLIVAGCEVKITHEATTTEVDERGVLWNIYTERKQEKARVRVDRIDATLDSAVRVNSPSQGRVGMEY